VRDDIEAGAVRVAVGTHALLSDKITFANLGLLVVDEEQRFGVKQKEKIKGVSTNVDVLSLTATPIPYAGRGASNPARVAAERPGEREAVGRGRSIGGRLSGGRGTSRAGSRPRWTAHAARRGLGAGALSTCARRGSAT